MKRLLAVIVLLTLLCVPAAAVDRPLALRHDLRVALQPATASLKGRDTLTVRTDEAKQIVLTLAQTAEVEAVRVDGEPAPHTFSGGRLAVKLPEPLPPEVAVEVDYRAVFADPVPERPLHGEDPTYGVAATIGTQGTFLSWSAGWYPDIPGSVAAFSLQVEAPPGTVAVAAGRLAGREQTEERSVTAWESAPLPSLTIAAGPFEVREATAGGIPVYTFFRPETGELAETYLRAAADYLELYQKLFGPYPFEKFAVVENFFPTGYGFPSWTLLGSAVVRLPFIVETSLGHEIAHSWWGTGVRVGPGGNWSEGLTTYVADHLYKERASAEEGRAYRLKILRDYAALVPPGEDFPLAAFAGRSSAAGQAVGYGKAAMVFHMARRILGEEAFWTGLRRLAGERMGQNASWADFAAAWGRPYDSFLAPWLERPGAPVLALEGVEAVREGDRWRVSGRVRQAAPFYALRVPLRLETAGGAVEATVAAEGAETPFALVADSSPLRLTVDPEADLFRRLDPAELPPTVNAIRGARQLLVVAARSLPAGTLAAARELLAALRQAGAEQVREEALDPADLAGRDLLFLGLPAAELLPPLPEDLEVAPGRFALDGEDYADPGAALFAALPHPGDAGRTAALFLPLSADAARRAVPKIPHYGKYSYLAFVNGQNRDKGTWPAGAAPAVHLFALGEETP